MTDVIDRTVVKTYRTATHDEKAEAGVPTHLWMGVIAEEGTPTNVVGAGVYTAAREQEKKARTHLEYADSWIRSFAQENELTDDEDPVLISLSQVNALLAEMGCERIATVREFTFTASITYEVGGSVFAKDEDAAREYVETLMLDIGEPDINEPDLDGDSEEWYDVAATYSDHDITDVSYA